MMKLNNKSKKKKLLVVICFSAFLIPLLSSYLIRDFTAPLNEFDNLEGMTEIQPKNAGFWNLAPIDIDNLVGAKNWATVNASNAWCNGAGTWADPYVIENVTINGGNTNHCLSILDSDVYFIIKNCTFFNAGEFDAGIYLSNTTNGFLIDNNCSNNDYYGIDLYGSKNNTLSGNICEYNLQTGIKLDFFDTVYSDDNNITGNICNDNIQGITIYGSDNNIIANKNCSYNNQTGIVISDFLNSTVTGNDCSYNKGFYGISGYSSNETYCLGNTVNNNTIIGIYLNGCNHSKISGNTVNNNGLGAPPFPGLDLRSDYCNITGNVCINNGAGGIEIEGHDNNATGNTCLNNGESGIKIRGNDNNATGNICNDNYIGIMIFSGNNNIISENTCNDSTIGIQITAGIANEVTFNTLWDNIDCILDMGTGTIIANNTCATTPDDGEPPDDNGDPSPPEIPGYNVIILIGAISVLLTILMKQRIKRIKKFEI